MNEFDLLKADILDMLEQVDKQPTLEKIQRYVARALKKEAAEYDWWNELTPEQQADLDAGILEIENPENLVSDEEAQKMFARWISKVTPTENQD